MSWADAYPTVKARVRAGLTETPGSFENGEGFDNQPFVPPSGAWLAVELVWTGSEAEAVDSAVRRRLGHVWAHAFVPRGTGADEAHRLAAAAAQLFEGQDLGGLSFQDAQPGGPSAYQTPDGSWYGQSVSIPFDFDEEKDP